MDALIRVWMTSNLRNTQGRVIVQIRFRETGPTGFVKDSRQGSSMGSP